MKKKLLEAKKNQHYVWGNYLLRWSNDEMNVWHSTPKGKAVSDSFRSIAKSDFFYRTGELSADHVGFIKSYSAQFPEDQQRQHQRFLTNFLKVQRYDDALKARDAHTADTEKLVHALRSRMMEDLHTKHELDARPIIDRLVDGDFSVIQDGENAAIFTAYLGHQMMRTKSMRDLMKLSFRFAAKDDDSGAQFSTLFDECWWFIGYMQGMALGWSLFNSRPTDTHCLLMNNTDEGFITSDQPLPNVHKDLDPNSLQPPDANTCDLFYPLSPRTAYMVNKSTRFPEGISEVCGEFVVEMNEKVANTADTLIIAADEATLKKYKGLVRSRKEKNALRFG